FFFFQAEDGIRDFHVTGVQTCALPISSRGPIGTSRGTSRCGNTCSAIRLKTGAATCPPSRCPTGESSNTRIVTAGLLIGAKPVRSEERRVGKECSSRWWEEHRIKKEEV